MESPDRARDVLPDRQDPWIQTRSHQSKFDPHSPYFRKGSSLDPKLELRGSWDLLVPTVIPGALVPTLSAPLSLLTKLP